MKKLLVLVVAMLALASFVTMAHADQDVFKDSWLYPMSQWQGSAQADYAVDGRTHAINTQMATSPTGPFNDPVVADPLDAANTVAQIMYDMNKESWSARVVQVNGSSTDTLNLAGTTTLDFSYLRGSSMVADVNISKIAMFDSNGVEVAVTNLPAASQMWQSGQISLSGRNLSGVNRLFYVVMTSNQNAANGSLIELLLDNVRYSGGNSGKVIVTMTTGVVGVSVTQNVDFTDLSMTQPLTANAAIDSSMILNELHNHFIVENIGKSVSNYSLNVVNPGGWSVQEPQADLTAVGTLAQNRFGIYGIFTATGSRPVIADYKGTLSATDRDTIGLTQRDASSAGIYGIAGSPSNGANVNPAELRDLSIGMKLPGSSTVTGNLEIIVVVTANAVL